MQASAPPTPFSPTSTGPLSLRNRLVRSATNEGMAKGGVGRATVAYCSTSLDGCTFVDQVTLDDASVPDLNAPCLLTGPTDPALNKIPAGAAA